MKFNDCFLVFITWSAMSIVNGCDALASDADTGSGEVSWHSEVASTALDAGDVATSLKDQILVWNDAPNPRVVAQEVYLMVDAPYDRMRRAIEDSLTPAGKFKFACEDQKLADLSDDWSNVLLSLHPEIREGLVKALVEPELNQRFKAGELTYREAAAEMDKARASLVPHRLERAKIEALNDTYAQCQGIREKSDGFLGRNKSSLMVQVLDVSMLFGHSATAVTISRTDTFPNPDFSLVKDKIIGQGTFFPVHKSPTLTRKIVPIAAFDAVYAAMRASCDGAKVRVAPSPLAWKAASHPEVKPSIPLSSTPADATLVPVEVTPWDALTGTEAGNRTPQDLLLLPNGDLVLSAGILTPQVGYSQQVWRLHESASKWEAHQIWKGVNGASQLALSADGEKVWFYGADVCENDTVMHIYDVKTNQFKSHAIVLPNRRETSFPSREWQLGGNQLPVFFDRTRGEKSGNPDHFQLISPSIPMPLDSEPWPFGMELDRAVMGNMIRPVHGQVSDPFWVEYPTKLAELDKKSGRVQRTVPLPLPLHDMNRSPTSFSFTPWAPRPLSAPTANWIAASFLQLHAPSQENPMPPVFGDNISSDHGGRFFGMHVMDVNLGTPRFSALLGRTDTLQAAARTANGRLLALGANAAYPDRGSTAALWDTTTGRAPVKLASMSTCAGFSAMAFSWDGLSLWALCNRQLLRWRLPENLQDQAAAGSFPDQVHQ